MVATEDWADSFQDALELSWDLLFYQPYDMVCQCYEGNIEESLLHPSHLLGNMAECPRLPYSACHAPTPVLHRDTPPEQAMADRA